MCALDLQAMYALEFLKYANMVNDYTANGELYVGMEFNDKKAVIRAIKNYIISKLVDCNVYKSESRTFYCKCKYYSLGCNWLVMVSLKKKKGIWEIRKYNSLHTCTAMMISQDHTKLDADMIAQLIEPIV